MVSATPLSRPGKVMTNEEAIAQHERAQGDSNAVIAGKLGNWEVESNFNPGSYNPGEQAIGIAQWEGSRRTQGLQVFARQRNKPETDLQTQLQWADAELAGPFSNVKSQLKKVSNDSTGAAAAATIVDRDYEISSGAARQTRIADAQSIYAELQAGKPLTGGGAASLTSTTGGNSGGGIGSAVGGGAAQQTTSPATIAAINANIKVPGTGIDIPFPNISNPLSFLNPITSVTGGLNNLVGIITPIASAFKSIEKLFGYMLWVFNPDNFMKLLLYVFGFLAVAAGLLMVIFATGKGAE